MHCTRKRGRAGRKGACPCRGSSAGKGKVARDKAAKLEVEQWVFQGEERHAEEMDELAARLSGSGDTAPAEAPKLALSQSETKKVAADAKAKANGDEAEQVKLKKDKARLK